MTTEDKEDALYELQLDAMREMLELLVLDLSRVRDSDVYDPADIFRCYQRVKEWVECFEAMLAHRKALDEEMQ